MSKFFTIALQLLFFSNLYAQSTIVTLPFYDGFDYPLGEKLTPTGTMADMIVPNRGFWVYQSTVSSPDPIMVEQPWVNSKGLPPCKGNAIQYKSGADDPIIRIPLQGEESGSVYASFLFRINSWTTSDKEEFFQTWIYNNAHDFIFSFAKDFSTFAETYNIFASKVFIKRDETGDGFTIGISESNVPSRIVYHPVSFSLNQDVLIVIRYGYYKNEGTSYMWVNPKVNPIEPMATVNTCDDKSSGNKKNKGTMVRTNIDKVLINKAHQKTPDITMDEVRIANTWHEVVGQKGHIPLSKYEISKLKNFTSSIVKNKLTISDNNTTMKKVEILDFLSKQLFLAETTDKQILIPNLQNGQYILKLTEGNTTTSYKVLKK